MNKLKPNQWGVYSFGRLMPGFEEAKVVRGLQLVFKLSEQQAVDLIAQKRFVKACDSQQQADQYLNKLESLGLAAFVQQPESTAVDNANTDSVASSKVRQGAAKLELRLEGEEEPLAIQADEKPRLLLCPKCGFEQPSVDQRDCVKCGVIIAKALERKQREAHGSAQGFSNTAPAQSNADAVVDASGDKLLASLWSKMPLALVLVVGLYFVFTYQTSTVQPIASKPHARAQYQSLQNAMGLPSLSPRELRQRLIAGEYSAVESSLKRMHEDMQDNAEWELPLNNAFQALSSANGIREQHLNDWVLYSRSSLSYLARAHFYKNEGWAARGSAFASETSAEKQQAFYDYHHMALRDFEKAKGLNSNWLPIYNGMMNIARSQKSIDVAELLGEAEQAFPKAFGYRYEYAVYLAPKWFGNKFEQVLYEGEVEPLLDSNPLLGEVMGYRHASLGNAARYNKQYTKCLRYYNQALEYAVTAMWLHKRAFCAMMDGQYEAAVVDAEASLALEYHKHVVEIREYSQGRI